MVLMKKLVVLLTDPVYYTLLMPLKACVIFVISLPYTKILCYVACRTMSKYLSVGSAEQSWVITAMKSVPSRSWNTHSKSYLFLSEMIIWEIVPYKWNNRLSILIKAICKKWKYVPSKFPHKSPFFKQPLSFSIHLSQNQAFTFAHLWLNFGLESRLLYISEKTQTNELSLE